MQVEQRRLRIEPREPDEVRTRPNDLSGKLAEIDLTLADRARRDADIALLQRSLRRSSEIDSVRLAIIDDVGRLDTKIVRDELADDLALERVSESSPQKETIERLQRAVDPFWLTSGV